MMTRPRHEDYTAEPPKEGSERNRQLAAGFEKKDSVKSALADERRQEMRNRLGYNSYSRGGAYTRGRGAGRGRGGYVADDRRAQGKASFSRIPLSQEELDRELDAYVQKRKAIKENEVVEAKIAKLEDKSEIKEEIEENKSDNLNTEIDDAVSKDGSPDDIELFTLDQKDGNEI